MKEFEFKKIITIKPLYFFLLAIIIAFPTLILYGEYGFKYFGVMGLIIIGIIILFLIFLILTISYKNVLIRFEDKYLYVKIGENTKKYLKEDIIGFYSHDYENINTCLIPKNKVFVSVKFYFSNGEKIEISDSQYLEKEYEGRKLEFLQYFLKTAQRELNFRAIKKNKWRSFINFGSVWYSKPK